MISRSVRDSAAALAWGLTHAGSLGGNPRRVFGRDQLMSRVWGYEAALDTGTVTVLET